MTFRVNDEQAFKELRQVPFIAWPTFLLLVFSFTTVAVVWYLCLTKQMPLWQGMILNGIAMYLMFSPAHDSMHRALSSNERLNNFLLFLSAQPGAPGTAGRAFRIMHMQHHRFANDHDQDPDHFIAANWKHAFTWWFVWDWWYLVHFIKRREELPPAARRQFYLDMAGHYAALGLLFWFLPWEAVFLWLIPTRISAWMICFTFMYLPHVPHDVPTTQDPYKATAIRKGWEWLLSPLLVCQNYHLVHHLYPTVPFYRYRAVWLARKDMHEANNPSVIPAFGLRPERCAKGAGEAAQV